MSEKPELARRKRIERQSRQFTIEFLARIFTLSGEKNIGLQKEVSNYAEVLPSIISFPLSHDSKLNCSGFRAFYSKLTKQKRLEFLLSMQRQVQLNRKIISNINTESGADLKRIKIEKQSQEINQFLDLHGSELWDLLSSHILRNRATYLAVSVGLFTTLGFGAVIANQVLSNNTEEVIQAQSMDITDLMIQSIDLNGVIESSIERSLLSFYHDLKNSTEPKDVELFNNLTWTFYLAISSNPGQLVKSIENYNSRYLVDSELKFKLETLLLQAFLAKYSNSGSFSASEWQSISKVFNYRGVAFDENFEPTLLNNALESNSHFARSVSTTKVWIAQTDPITSQAVEQESYYLAGNILVFRKYSSEYDQEPDTFIFIQSPSNLLIEQMLSLGYEQVNKRDFILPIIHQQANLDYLKNWSNQNLDKALEASFYPAFKYSLPSNMPSINAVVGVVENPEQLARFTSQLEKLSNRFSFQVVDGSTVGPDGKLTTPQKVLLIEQNMN
ncbi:MAG: hypothetical protein OHK0017_11430 [Patescibacteria group bacterium]